MLGVLTIANVKYLGYLVKYLVHLSLENLSDMFP